jgi:hypothetical protein
MDKKEKAALGKRYFDVIKSTGRGKAGCKARRTAFNEYKKALAGKEDRGQRKVVSK